MSDEGAASIPAALSGTARADEIEIGAAKQAAIRRAAANRI
jgi:hypothetical protein